MSSPIVNRYIQPISDIQSYLNILYLLLAFPLGLLYFIIFIVGFSLGIGLLIIWIGIFILAGVVMLSWAFAHFERQLAIALLHIELPAGQIPKSTSPRIWERIRSYLINPDTWKGLAFLFLKFPLGLLSFVTTVVSLAVSLGLIFAPFTYQNEAIHWGYFQIDSIEKAIFASFIGLVLFPLVVHLLNFIAEIYGLIARALLSG